MIKRKIKELCDIPKMLKKGKIAGAESILHRNGGRSPEIVQMAYRIIVSHASCNGDRLAQLFKLSRKEITSAKKGDIALFYQIVVPYFIEVDELNTVNHLIEDSMETGLSRSSYGPIWSVYCDKKGWFEEARQTLIDYFGFENAPEIAKRLKMISTADSLEKEWQVAA